MVKKQGVRNAPHNTPDNQDLVEVTSEAAATSLVDDFARDAGAGLENVTAQDVTIPRITILQALSPQLDRNNALYIPDARAGQICDVSTGEVFPEPLVVVPVYFQRLWLEWAPKNSGKGLVAIHTTDAVLANASDQGKRRNVLPNGNSVQETAHFYVLNLSAGMRRSFIGLASTQLKKARKWLTLATSERLTDKNGETFIPPLYYRTYHLYTIPESNAEGSWLGWRIERGVAISELANYKMILREARAFRASIVAGEAKADISDNSDHTSAASHNTADEEVM
jgi:hypothetical protein